MEIEQFFLKSYDLGFTLHQCLDMMRHSLKNSSSVWRLSPISTTLGHRADGGVPTRLLSPVSMRTELQGAAIIICNTKNRLEWEMELEDAEYILKTQLRLQVRTSLNRHLHPRSRSNSWVDVYGVQFAPVPIQNIAVGCTSDIEAVLDQCCSS